jgi:hypothetical protein
VIPDSVTSIYTSCFEGCTGLKGLTVNCPGDAFTIDENPIGGLNSLTDVYFNNGLPSAGWTLGTSNPVIHVSNKWNGYDVKDAAVDELEKKTIPLPATGGKIGQVLMVTADGYEWKDVPGGYSAAIADKFQLVSGWNLVSLPEAELTASCKAELLKAYVFFTFDKNTRSYVRTETLLPRGCYWIYVKEPCTIHFTKAE